MPASSQPFVDVEAVVNVRIVDQPFPTHRRPRLLEIRSHHNEQVIFVELLQNKESVGIVEGRRGIMDGARTDDNEETVILVRALNTGGDFIAGIYDSLL